MDSLAVSSQNGSSKKRIKELTGQANQDIFSYCKKGYEQARQSRVRFEREWYLNLAFYFGKQWVTWTSGGSALSNTNYLSRLHEPKAPPWRVRLVSNRVRKIARTEMSKLTREHPTAFVIPDTSDDSDLAAARAGEAVFEHVSREVELPKLTRRAVFWAVVCGSGFLKDWWDDSYQDSQCKGRIIADVVSPFHLLAPDLQEETLEYQPFIIHATAKDPSWVFRNYGISVPATSDASADVLESRFLRALGIQDSRKRFCSVKEMWLKPCKYLPMGGVVTWANDQLLNVVDFENPPKEDKEDVEQNPMLAQVQPGWCYEHGEYPFTKIDNIPAGRFYGDSILVDLIPIQREYNRTRSQLIEDKNKMARPQLMAQQGSVDPNKITSEPGLIITYKMGYQPPTPLHPAPVPAYVTQELDRCINDLNDISGQHDVSQGTGTIQSNDAATAISYMTEQDETVLAYAIASIEDAHERIGRHILHLANQFWGAPRTVRTLGEDSQFDIVQLSRANLKGNTNLKVEAGSAMPRSRSAKQAFIMELGKMNWIPPNKALQYLDMAETGQLYEMLSLDQRQAQRENIRLMQDDPSVVVNTWDNDEAHIDEHNNYRKKQEYDKANDQQRQAFEDHVNAHMQQMASKQGVPAAPGEVPPGGPGGPPPPPGAEPPPPGGPPGGAGQPHRIDGGQNLVPQGPPGGNPGAGPPPGGPPVPSQ